MHFAITSFLLFAVPALGCPHLWLPVGDGCYKTSHGHLDWYDAQQYCDEEGGYLIEIRDSDEQASLLSFLQRDTYYWIGLTDLTEEGIWVWQTDFAEASYTHWLNGQPNNAGGGQDCALLESQYFLWSDYECHVDYHKEEPISYIHALCETGKV